MQSFFPFLTFIIGVLVGITITAVLFFSRKKDETKIDAALRDTFASLSFEALRKNTDQFLKMAHETLGQKTSLASSELENKKALIDKTLSNIETQIRGVQQAIQTAEQNQSTNLNLLRQHLEFSKESVEGLKTTTDRLHQVLSHTKARGAWGERMAEDVLRLVGLEEGINYSKQSSYSLDEGGKSRPDFTFFLPQNLKLNMDAKFPFDNYLKYFDAQAETDKEQFKKQFFKDVTNRIKEAATREYINEETVDYCLVFIPNEQVYAFIQAENPKIFDEALSSRIVLVSPATLYAVLAVVRKAIDSFNLGKTHQEILKNLGFFRKQWEVFLKSLQVLGKRIADTQKEYDELLGPRKRQLERSIGKLEALKDGEGTEKALEGDEISEDVTIETAESSAEKS